MLIITHDLGVVGRIRRPCVGDVCRQDREVGRRGDVYRIAEGITPGLLGSVPRFWIAPQGTRLCRYRGAPPSAWDIDRDARSRRGPRSSRSVARGAEVVTGGHLSWGGRHPHRNT